MREKDKRTKSLLQRSVAINSFLPFLYPRLNLAQFIASPRQLWFDVTDCSAKQAESKQTFRQVGRQHPALPLLPNFCLQKEAAANTFCIFSCSIFTALCLLWKKWPYSCAKHVTAPKGQPVLFPSKAALKPRNGWVGCSG